jgi:hypothetical protein
MKAVLKGRGGNDPLGGMPTLPVGQGVFLGLWGELPMVMGDHEVFPNLFTYTLVPDKDDASRGLPGGGKAIDG